MVLIIGRVFLRSSKFFCLARTTCPCSTLTAPHCHLFSVSGLPSQGKHAYAAIMPLSHGSHEPGLHRSSKVKPYYAQSCIFAHDIVGYYGGFNALFTTSVDLLQVAHLISKPRKRTTFVSTQTHHLTPPLPAL